MRKRQQLDDLDHQSINSFCCVSIKPWMHLGVLESTAELPVHVHGNSCMKWCSWLHLEQFASFDLLCSKPITGCTLRQMASIQQSNNN